MKDEILNRKYIAVKPKGFDYYIWFEQEKVIQDLVYFIGRNGWGKNGAFTNLKCRSSEIESFIYSDELQYT
jgi:hypothetical protein